MVTVNGPIPPGTGDRQPGDGFKNSHRLAKKYRQKNAHRMASLRRKKTPEDRSRGVWRVSDAEVYMVATAMLASMG